MHIYIKLKAFCIFSGPPSDDSSTLLETYNYKVTYPNDFLGKEGDVTPTKANHYINNNTEAKLPTVVMSAETSMNTHKKKSNSQNANQLPLTRKQSKNTTSPLKAKFGDFESWDEETAQNQCKSMMRVLIACVIQNKYIK